MAEIIRIQPQIGPQETFLSTNADIAVYGGSAFGGKTYGLLLDPLRHINVRGFGAVIFRRESVQITNQGGLWDESYGLYPLVGGVPTRGNLKWKFKRNYETISVVTFRHLQHETDVLNWQGSSICMLGFDELTHFTEHQFWYMFSRNRSTCGIRPYLRATTNPEPGWVKEFLAQWVDKTHKDPAKSGEIRWMLRIDGKLIWSHDRQELIDKYPPEREDDEDRDPKSVTFIRSSIRDNKIGMSKDPGYLGNLQALLPVEKARLLDGDWDVKREGLCYPGLAECVCDFDLENLPSGRKIGGVDFGWNNPFCALNMICDHDDIVWVWHEHYLSFTTLPVHARTIPNDGTQYFTDPSRPESTAELINAGHFAMPCVHLGSNPLLDGIDRVVERVRTNRLRIHRSCQNLLRESNMCIFGPDGKPIDKDNHSLDALRYGIVGLDRGRAIKRLAVPADRVRTLAIEHNPTELKGVYPAERKQKEREIMDDRWFGG